MPVWPPRASTSGLPTPGKPEIAGYSYGATWGLAPAGLAPASLTVSFAALLPRVPERRVPPVRRYYGTLRIPPSFPPHLITCDGYCPMRLRSLPWTRRRSRAWSFRVWQPHANCGQRRTDTLKFPGSPSVPLPCSRDPGRTAASGHTTQRRGPRSSDGEGSHDQTAFGAQSHGFSTRCLRFAPRLSPSDARLASAVGQLYGAGLQPAGLLRKVSSMTPTSPPPFPDLP